MILNLSVGPQSMLAAGGPSARGSYDGSMVTQDGHARYQEAVYRGNVYTAAQVVGTTVPAGLSASPTTTVLYNPLGSGVYGVIWYAGITASVAVAAASVIWIAQNFGGAATTGTPGLVTNNKTGQITRGSILPLTTATLPAAPTNVVATLGVLFAAALTVNNQQPPLGRWFDGAILLAPGNALSFQGSTAGGAAGCFGEWIYEEVPTSMG